ncbi:hypothetical protein M758_1G099000 [Ceratodon purpureus]|nr:hypothetical protein M758_1G099000 [Ceratodon purpureus]
MLRGGVNRGNKVAKAMITLIHNHEGLATDTKCPSCPEQPDSTRVTMELEGNDPLRAEPLIQEGDDNGDHGENHDVAIAAGDGGHGLNNLDPGAIVDGILADLPEPSRRHILPELEEYDRARPADLCSAT